MEPSRTAKRFEFSPPKGEVAARDLRRSARLLVGGEAVDCFSHGDVAATIMCGRLDANRGPLIVGNRRFPDGRQSPGDQKGTRKGSTRRGSPAAAAPATVSGERLPPWATGKPGRPERAPRPASQETCRHRNRRDRTGRGAPGEAKTEGPHARPSVRAGSGLCRRRGRTRSNHAHMMDEQAC